MADLLALADAPSMGDSPVGWNHLGSFADAFG
jgi:hypothetical protein